MILVDSAVWVDHFRTGDRDLSALLEADLVVTHPMVIAELALGSLARRNQTLADLGKLWAPARASDTEVLAFVERQNLSSRGIGVVDAHLLAATLLVPGAALWTRDKRLAKVAAELGVGWSPSA
jgi:hypothetical protein